MAQFNLGTIDPATTSGAQLANRLTQWAAAVSSNHSGPTAPTYGTQGMCWADTSVDGKIIMRQFDGTDWVELYETDITTNAVTIPGIAILGEDVAFGQVESASGDLWAHGWGGNENTGVLFLNASRDRYVHYDGSFYQMPSAGLNVGGRIAVGTGGAQVSVDGNLYMPWAGAWLSTVLNGKQPVGNYQPAGYYAGLGANQFSDTQFVYYTGAARVLLAAQATIGSFDSTVCDLRVNRGPSSAFNHIRCWTNYTGTQDTTFKVRGDGVVTADGSFSGGGADYAEYFEWQDGNPDGEDRRGVSVILTGEKIRPATAQDDPDDILGVVSSRPVVVGDAHEDRWSGKYLKDEFGEYIYEDVERIYWKEIVGREPEKSGQKPGEGDPIYEARVTRTDQWPTGVAVPRDAQRVVEPMRIVSPDYDPEQTYVPRSQRPEWAAVGLVGKLATRKGQPRGTRWRKMKDLSADVELLLIR